jgi:Mrp family chromosome partitioning ATPase
METVVINQIKDQSYTMKESLRALKTSISFSGKGVKSILFTSSVPNEGKTTVVMDLARSMADSKKSVLVVDTDMRKSVLVGRLRAKVESGGKIYGLSHYLSGQVSLDKVVYATNIKGVFIQDMRYQILQSFLRQKSLESLSSLERKILITCLSIHLLQELRLMRP